jgi:hypothetical protein
MKCSTQTALVLAVGYMLGRRRKLRIATVLTAAAATGGVGRLGGAAVRRGLKTLGSSQALGDLGPQVSAITESVRGDLVEAGKAAVLASVTNRIGSLSDSLHDRAEGVRTGAADTADKAAKAGDAVRSQGKRARRGGGREETEPDEREPEDEYEDEEDEYEDEPEEEDRAPRRRAPRRPPVARTRR